MAEPTGERSVAYPGIVPYLLVADAAGLIGFLEAAFGAVPRFAAPSDAGGITHAEVALGGGLIMISDSGPPRAPVYLCHYVADVDAVYRRAIAAGAASERVPETPDYGTRIGGIVDPAGNTWWICAQPG